MNSPLCGVYDSQAKSDLVFGALFSVVADEVSGLVSAVLCSADVPVTGLGPPASLLAAVLCSADVPVGTELGPLASLLAVPGLSAVACLADWAPFAGTESGAATTGHPKHNEKAHIVSVWRILTITMLSSALLGKCFGIVDPNLFFSLALFDWHNFPMNLGGSTWYKCSLAGRFSGELLLEFH